MAALFTTERHVKYYLRCLKTFLPSAYTSNDSNRMLLAYFSLSGLDVLGVLQAKTTPEERQSYINWLYHCQVPSGGFRGFPGTDFGEERRTVDNAVWDPANVPATFFALVNLLILGDDLSRVKRRECLQWLPQLQRADGSFGEVLGPNARIEGDRDLRYCMCAAGIRLTMAEWPNPLSVNLTVGIPIGSLDFLRRAGTDTQAVPMLSPGSEKFEILLSWLASRQTGELGEEEEEDEEDDEDDETGTSVLDTQPTEDVTRSLEEKIIALPGLTALSTESIPCAGFNGRCNKFADTCYSFWNGATLMMLDRYSVIDDVRNRRYLLEKVQHLVGGFGKSVGDPRVRQKTPYDTFSGEFPLLTKPLPDLLHSYFGMVSLAFQGEEGLARVDPALVTTERVVQHLESLSWRS
ncbi:hypothetical protein N7494_011577 [Penicillium frequentans]|uniref:Prenyltransferase alpha-alpha toroid domain-containing protein n=1 Tax=Penicillium frequentans TaxID=3151616 RepID=A0AAD6CMT2_9EURO|nr:hypothetical protein N7494_011577 [Penicillium glabrum]